MKPTDPLPKLRLAPAESLEDLAQRVEREREAAQRDREEHLGESVGPFRIGSVPYLNAAPLIRGFEDQVILEPPSQLAEGLRRGELDAALVSVTEVLLNDRYDVLDGVAIASLGEVQSVLLAHRRPLEEIREVYCDPASLTSRLLVQVLLAERGLRPQFKPLASYDSAARPDFVLLIGDPALDLLLGPRDQEVWDLGSAWFELTGLPFVYAVWALRREIDHAPLRRRLHEAKRFGLQTLDAIIRAPSPYPQDFRRDYLGWHIHYHLGTDEKRGVDRFRELLEKHGLGPTHALRYVF
jgi:chorismate dehydratase